MSSPEKEIIDLAKLTATGFYEPSTSKFPNIKNYNNIRKWDFFLTAAIVGCCVMHLQMEEDEEKSNAMQVALGNELTNFHPQGWKAVEDLFGFLDNVHKPNLPKTNLTDSSVQAYLKKLTDLIAASVGSWLVLNLKGSTPSKKEYPICSMLGNLAYKKLGVELAIKYAEAIT